MKKVLLPLFVGIATISASAQFSSTTVEVFKIHDGQENPELAGYTTYRVWLNTVHENDFISMVYGNTVSAPGIPATQPMAFTSSSGDVFQSEMGNHMPPSCALFSIVPSAEYDSFFTIGSVCSGSASESVMQVSTNPAGYFSMFESGTSASANEGGYFTVQSFENGWSGENKRVLVAQFTTTGPWQYCFSIQGQANGIPGTENTFNEIDICASSDQAQGVGIQDAVADGGSSVVVYPNPCSDKFFAEIGSSATVTIYDLLGKQVALRVLQSGRHEFDMTGYQDGVYIVVVKYEGETVTKRLVKH